ncbi:MAG: family 20 glycosylhydrolase [bacterium]|nr:family 20 glycosylhydrolase [bacterium]
MSGVESQRKTSESLIAGLLPQPKRFTATGGSFRLPDELSIGVCADLDSPASLALARLQTLMTECCGVRTKVEQGRDSLPTGALVVRVAPEAIVEEFSTGAVGADRAAQAYCLSVSPEGAELTGASSMGVYYGLVTLHQWLRACGREWPAVEVGDAPDYAVRGLSYDVSRGRVPTLKTLKELADRLAFFKINHLQLYLEHTFAFGFSRNIGRGCSPLSATDIREFDAYCAERGIALVPALASFGHMGHVLSLPEYRHLAEIETTRSWEEMAWGERMRGLTLDVANAESRMLLESMYAELLPLFSAPFANVCCDETYDLGKGKNAARAEAVGAGRLYVEHVRWLCELCRRHGKQPMYWGDVIKQHPELIEEIPADAIVLNWGYSADTDYESTARFCEAGRTTYVCPGTNAWNRILNDINEAELNIRRYARAGVEYGAAGLLNTDWGDEGHFNVMAGSWHPVVLGASMAWNTAAPEAEDFDRAFGRLMLGDDSGESVNVLRRVVAASNLVRSWPTFCAPLRETVSATEWPDARLEEWTRASRAGEEYFSRREGIPPECVQDWEELEIACRMNVLVAERIRLAGELVRAEAGASSALADRLGAFAEACTKIAPEYARVWLGRHRRSNLDEILAVFTRLAEEARHAAGGLG